MANSANPDQLASLGLSTTEKNYQYFIIKRKQCNIKKKKKKQKRDILTAYAFFGHSIRLYKNI